MLKTSCLVSAFALLTLAAAPADPIAAAVAGAERTPANVARDRYRHPAATLRFFGLKPTQVVVEISPSGGYFTEILAPVLRDQGHLVLAGKPSTALAANLAAHPGVFGRPQVVAFGPKALDLGAPASADLVVTFRNVHNWVQAGFAPAAFQAFYRVLKPGGTLGVEEHRLPEARADTPATANSGYQKVSAVIALARAAGFRLVARSEVNANPKDTADYPGGVWTLPPNYADGAKDRARYAAIGESDRMTLRFVKPVS